MFLRSRFQNKKRDFFVSGRSHAAFDPDAVSGEQFSVENALVYSVSLFLVFSAAADRPIFGSFSNLKMNWLSFPFVRYTSALMSGILVARLLPAASLTLLGFSWLLLAIGYICLHRRRPGWLGLSFLLVSGCLTVFLHNPATKSDWIGRKPVRGYVAVVTSAPEKRATVHRTFVRVTQLHLGSCWQSGSGVVLCYLEGGEKLRYGDQLLITGTPDLIPPPQNPGEFDYRAYQSLSGVFHQQYLREGSYRLAGHSPPSRLMARAIEVSLLAAELLDNAFLSREDATVATAMLIGLRADIDPELLQAYSSAGAIHALSVSGMHVGILFLVVGRILGFLKNRGNTGRWLFAGLALALVWGYALLTGLSTPVVRSALMLSLLVTADTFRLDANPLNTLAFSAFVTLLVQPLALFQMSFQLSYLSVGGLIVIYPVLRWLWRPENPLLLEVWEMSCGAVAAQAVTFPLAVYYFHQFPTYFLLANPFVLSLSAGGLIFGLGYLAFAWIPVLEDFLSYCLQLFFGGLNGLIRLADRLPGARWTGLSLLLSEYFLISSVIVFLLLLLTRRKRALFWPALLAAAFFLCQKLFAYQQHRHQEILIIHHSRKQGVISVIRGRTQYLWMPRAPGAAVLSRSVLCLQPAWGIVRTDSVSGIRSIPGGQAGVVSGRIVVWLSHYTLGRIRFPYPVDYLVFSHNARRYPDKALLASVVNVYIFDATNSPATVERWRRALLPLGKRCVDIRRQGAFVSAW